MSQNENSESATGRALRELKAREAALEDEIEPLRRELDGVKRAIQALEKIPSQATDKRQTSFLPKSTKLTIPEAAAAILRQAGRPMKTSEITKELQEQGVIEKKEHADVTVFSSLRRNAPPLKADGKFRKKAIGTWALANSGGAP